MADEKPEMEEQEETEHEETMKDLDVPDEESEEVRGGLRRAPGADKV